MYMCRLPFTARFVPVIDLSRLVVSVKRRLGRRGRMAAIGPLTDVRRCAKGLCHNLPGLGGFRPIYRWVKKTGKRYERLVCDF